MAKSNPTETASGRLVSVAAAVPADPLQGQQWHLGNQAIGRLDLNVLPVWEDYSGEGVTAVVIDDGFDYRHPDIAPNYDPARDWDYDGNDADPSGVAAPYASGGDSHGTATIGLLGAAANGIGTVGVAWGASLIGYRVYGYIEDRFIEQLAQAIEDGTAAGADLISMSLGTQYAANFFDQALDPALMGALAAAIAAATDEGRGGLGTLLVKAAGNGGDGNPPHDANLASWNANPRVISVAALDADGDLSSYSTPGANVFVAGFGSPIQGQVVTTDRQGGDGYSSGDYVYDFNGTSAATPMVAGVIALMLEANPGLGWLDVQAILAATARRYDDQGSQLGSNADWTWNGASGLNGGGYHFSEGYGFGLVDAEAAVRLAETWQASTTSADLESAAVDALDASLTVPDNDAGGLTLTFQGPGGIEEIAFVELTLGLSHRWVGDLQITLTSPSGTTTTLFDQAAGGTSHPTSWTYAANAFRGESAEGTWTLVVRDLQPADVGRLQDVVLTAHGRGAAANDLYVITEEYAFLQSQGGRDGSLVDGDGGRDVVNTAPLTEGATLDLSGGGGALAGRSLAIFGIEDGILGIGADRAIGSSAVNRLYGGDGDDSLSGKTAADSLFGGSGADRLEEAETPGQGADAFWGGSGADSLSGGSGADTLRGQQQDDWLGGGSGADTLLAAGGDDLVYGGAGLDRLGGGSGSDSLFGDANGDFLNGGSGVDQAAGGGGDDSFLVDTAHDVVAETAGGGLDDLLRSNADSYHLPEGEFGYIERALVVLDGDRADLFGNSFDNFLMGGEVDDRLAGFSGDDTLNGRSGSDIMTAGPGADTFVVDTAGDQVRDFDGQGVDLVRAYTSYTLPEGDSGDFVEHLRLQNGRGDLDGTGNGLDNRLEGNEGDNRLAGNQGADRILGGDGDDEIFGGADADRMEGDSGADTLSMGKDDLAFGGSGDDWFLFRSANLGSGEQRILDFSAGDRLAFATGLEVGSFSYLGSAGFSGNGSSAARLAAEERLEVDQDGDGSTDIVVELRSISQAEQLSANDFLWLS